MRIRWFFSSSEANSRRSKKPISSTNYNLEPSSTRYCRPIKFQFSRETSHLAKTEYEYIHHQIEHLRPTVYENNGRRIQIYHELLFTMIDADSRLDFGISVLHAWIRFFECLLNLSYKLPWKQWQVTGEERKQLLETRKAGIKLKLKTQMGLIVDKPKPGYGSSNDGNTARRFFENAEISSTIKDIEVEVIKRFRTILIAIASGYR
nr:unnamed protein product [Callosobruchus analis]